MLVAGAETRCRPVVAAPQAVAAALHLSPLADLVPAAGLRWIADVRPKELLRDPALIPAVAAAVPEAELDGMARAWGGIDLRAVDALVIGGFDAATLFLAQEPLDPARVEVAFGARVADVEGRAIDEPRTAGASSPPLVRVWGSVGTRHETLVLFGRDAAGLAVGSDVPLRAAELFALQRMKRARPAWQAPPLDRMASLLGEAPIRAAAPGPFGGPWAAGLGGLLASTTAAGVAIRPDGEALRVTLILMGGWGERSGEARGRLERRYDSLAKSGLGRLTGLDRPVVPPRVVDLPDALELEVSVRAAPLLRGLRDATSAEVEAIMRRPDE
jgi:hypothetical protein